MNKSLVFAELQMLLEKTLQAAPHYPWEDKNFYCAWLAQTTYYVRHSTRLLALGGALAPLQQQELHNRFLKHA
ncbi:MAG TPA: hypothetical protein VN132_15950, partial [Bdellovibrio sp.]|nr:hypothetical protein [Bdellovibrio sp.]